jgi:hypothetical protein
LPSSCRAKRSTTSIIDVARSSVLPAPHSGAGTEEAAEVHAQGRALTELSLVGPWVATIVRRWLEDAVAEAGCRVTIDTDAHAPHELAFVEFGIAAAIRAGIRRERVVNFLPRDELLAWSRARRYAVSRAI